MYLHVRIHVHVNVHVHVYVHVYGHTVCRHGHGHWQAGKLTLTWTRTPAMDMQHSTADEATFLVDFDTTVLSL